MVSVQLEKGISKEAIRKSLDLDDKFGVDIPVYIEFCIENDIVVKDTESGKYRITNYGREFISAFLPAGEERRAHAHK
jgi:predicted transcriptional regulator